MVIPSNFNCADSTRSSDKRSSGKLPSQEPAALSSPFLLADNMRDFDISRRSSDTVAGFLHHVQYIVKGIGTPFCPAGLTTDTAPGLATDAQARRNISHYQFIVNTAGCLLSPLSQRIWGAPVCTGTTGGGGAPGRRRAHPGGGGNPRPHIVIPATPGGRRWVPVSTATTDAPRRRRESTHPSRHSREGGNPRRGAGGWVPASTGTTVGTHRHSREGGNPWRGAGGWVPVSTGTTDAPTSSFPRRREGDDGFPSPRERRTHPHRHSRDGARAGMGSRLHGNDGGAALR